MTEVTIIVYNKTMKIMYYLWILLIAAGGSGLLHAGQPPADEKRPTKSVGQDRSQGVPLDKLPMPENGIIVVTPDLKKALDVLGAGSVVLSAERYLELMNKAEKSKPTKSSTEMLFAKCLITGEVKTVAGREVADLTFDLDFRTETPNAIVPIPFKGIRISSATLNGQPPIWGPEPEKWTLLIKDPQVCRLNLSTRVPVTRVGQEKRLVMDRVPASAITSLELTVPGKISSAMVLGYGSITVTPLDSGKTSFSAPALGVLSSLELTWQAEAKVNASAPASIEGDLRMTLDEAQGLVEARFKPVPFAPIQLPWKIRLPKNSQQVRADLARSETGGAESLVVTSQTDGTYVLTTPYAVNMTQFTQVIIRWRQPLPESESAEPILLGSCELIEPTDKQQNGTLQVVMPEEQTVFLKPFKLISADRNFLLTERENRRNPRYLYSQQPAGLEATSLPRAFTKGLVEARLLHTLGAQDQSWFLNTEIEIVRSSRANLSQLELDWPADWQVSRKLLFSPAVKEIEQDTKAERLRIILDGRQPASFTLKLESVSASLQNQVSIRLPHLLTANAVRNDRSIPVDVIQQERLRLDNRGWNIEIDEKMIGLREDTGEEIKQGESNYYHVIGYPAQLSVQRQPRLPKWTSQLEAYIGIEKLHTKQHIQLHSQSSLPRKLIMRVPRSVKSVQFSRLLTDQRSPEPMRPTVIPNEENSPWKNYSIELPLTSDKTLKLLCECEQESNHPITVPFVRLEETVALFEGKATVLCIHETGVKLSIPPELEAWKLLKQEPGKIELQSESMQSLLVLDREKEAVIDSMQRIIKDVFYIEKESSSFLIEHETDFGELRQTTLKYIICGSRSSMTLMGWKLNEHFMPINQVQWDEQDNKTTLTFILPPEKLFSSVRVTVALRHRLEGRIIPQLPITTWNVGSTQNLIPVNWHLKSDPTHWLWWTNKSLDKSMHANYGWLPFTSVQGAENESEWTLNFQGLASTEPLRWLAVPRSLSIVTLSTLALIFLRILQHSKETGKRVLWLVLCLLLILFAGCPELATVLFWGVLPGILIALVIHWIKRLRQNQTRRTPVFQLTGILNQSTVSSLPPIRKSPDAQTVITTSPSVIR